MLGKFILEQRKKHNLTQEFLASKIGVSRPTYVQIEQGERDLTITEARKLSDIFGIVFDDFVQGKESLSPKIKLEERKTSKKIKLGKQEIRIDVPQKNIKKFKEVLLYVLEKVGSKSNVGMTVLYKLLYFIDFDYYEKFEEQLVGATYIKNRFGPTPVEFKKIVESMESKGELETVKSKYFLHEQTKYLPRREPDISVLNAKEIKHIDEVLSRLSDKSATELSDYSHKDVPWITAEDGRPLSYESVFYRTKDTSVREYEPDNL